MSGMRVAVGDFNDPFYRQKRKELLDLLTSMGYPAAYANKAIDQVDPTLDSAAELCFHWFEENPMPSQSKQEQYGEQIKEMSAMGFSREESKRALSQASGDINKAVFYLLADKTKELKAAIREEQAEYERVTRGGPDETFSTGDTPFDDDSRIIDELKKVDLNQADAATENAPNTEIKALTQQIVQLQELVLTYQNKYLALKRRVAKIKGNDDEEAPEQQAPAPKTPAKKDATSPRPNPAAARELTRQNSKHNMAAAAASVNSPEKPAGPAIRDLARSLSPLPRRGTESGGSPSPPAASPNRNKSSSTSSSQPPAPANPRAAAPAARPGAPPARRGEEPPSLVYGQSSSAAKKPSSSGSAARK